MCCLGSASRRCVKFKNEGLAPAAVPTHRVEPFGAAVRIVVDGVECLDDLLEVHRALAADASFDPQQPRCWDMRPSSLRNFTSRDAHRLAASTVGRPVPADPRVAVLVSETVDFGVARMLQGMAGDAMPEDLRVVRNEDEARRWLGVTA